jgi:DNA-binding response OmpR family regulator
VLADVLVHGPHGFELCRRLRETYDAETLPVLLCTDIYGGEIFQEEARRVGAQKLLLKPIAPDDLLAEIAEVVARVTDQAA